MAALLSVTDLEVFYGRIQAIKGISFEVNEGEIVTLIGANGAGKTTTMKTMSGVRPVAAGSIVFNGIDITRCPEALPAPPTTDAVNGSPGCTVRAATS